MIFFIIKNDFTDIIIKWKSKTKKLESEKSENE